MNPSHPPTEMPVTSSMAAEDGVEPLPQAPVAGEARFARDETDTKRALDEQEKVLVRLHQVPPDSTDRPLPDEFVQVNGHNYVIQRGVDVEVPRTVREILIQAGRY